MKTSSISRRVAVIRCRRPTGCDGRAGQRDVDDVGGQPRLQLAGLEPAAARLERGLERPARLVGGAADGAALLRRQLGDAAQQVGQLGLAAQEAHADVLQRGRVRRAGDGRLALGAQLCDAVKHGARILRSSSYRATVAAIPAFSDSERIGMCATSSQAATTRRGQPLALGADDQRHVARRGRARSSGAPSRGDQRDRAAGQLATARARGRPGRRTARPSRRGPPCGPYGSALPGPSATLPAPNASAERSAVPTLPGSLTPHSARQSGPSGAGAQRWP